MSEAEFPRRIGRGMIFAAAIAVLALLTAFFDSQLDAQRNPNDRVQTSQSDGIRQVILDANRQDHYVATAAINGQPVEVLVDTGATQVAIAASTARRLGLTFGARGAVSTANGMTEVFLTRLDSVRLGNIELRDVDATIVPRMDDPEVLLGMNFLRDLEMTHRDGQLILRQY